MNATNDDYDLNDRPDHGDLKAGAPPVLEMETPPAEDSGRDFAGQVLQFPPKECLDLPTPELAQLQALINMGSGRTQPRSLEFKELAVTSGAANPRAGAAQTVLPEGWILMGSIESASPVILAGQVVGDVLMQPSAKVEVRKTGKVDGTLTGTEVVVQGEVVGRVDASNGSVWIEEGARISGQVLYTRIRMDGGTHKIELTHVAADAACAV